MIAAAVTGTSIVGTILGANSGFGSTDGAIAAMATGTIGIVETAAGVVATTAIGAKTTAATAEVDGVIEMDCNETERLISADRDGALTESQRSVLEAHLGSCARCRQFRANLAAAAAAWKSSNQSAKTSDVDREWFAIRRRIRHLEESDSVSPVRRWRQARWLSLPIGAAAALLAAALFLTDPEPKPPSVVFAAAEYVEVEDESASVVVFVDEESGWLVVWSLPEVNETGT